jgi:hypothetical protein
MIFDQFNVGLLDWGRGYNPMETSTQKQELKEGESK